MSDEELEPLKKWIHESNNRLGIILATAELLQLEQLPPRAAQRTQQIEHETLALRELLRQIVVHYLE